jgi:outer membrane PBP1 activator LpoA protein
MDATRILPLAALLLVVAGCSKDAGHAKPGHGTGEPAATGEVSEEKQKASRPGGVFGVRDETQNRLILRDIGIACLAENVGRLPQTLDELKAIVKDSPKAKKAVDNGELVLVSKAQPRHDSLFLHERDPDARGNRLVLMGDGTVHRKNAEEFAAMKK